MRIKVLLVDENILDSYFLQSTIFLIPLDRSSSKLRITCFLRILHKHPLHTHTDTNYCTIQLSNIFIFCLSIFKFGQTFENLWFMKQFLTIQASKINDLFSHTILQFPRHLANKFVCEYYVNFFIVRAAAQESGFRGFVVLVWRGQLIIFNIFHKNSSNFFGNLQNTKKLANILFLPNHPHCSNVHYK